MCGVEFWVSFFFLHVNSDDNKWSWPTRRCNNIDKSFQETQLVDVIRSGVELGISMYRNELTLNRVELWSLGHALSWYLYALSCNMAPKII